MMRASDAGARFSEALGQREAQRARAAVLWSIFSADLLVSPCGMGYAEEVCSIGKDLGGAETEQEEEKK